MGARGVVVVPSAPEVTDDDDGVAKFDPLAAEIGPTGIEGLRGEVLVLRQLVEHWIERQRNLETALVAAATAVLEATAAPRLSDEEDSSS